MSSVIGYTADERDAFANNAAMLAELVLLKTPLVRLAIRHGIPRELLLRDLHSHLGMCIATLHAEVDGAALVDGPTALPSTPVRVREKFTQAPRHPGPHKKRPAA